MSISSLVLHNTIFNQYCFHHLFYSPSYRITVDFTSCFYHSCISVSFLFPLVSFQIVYCVVLNVIFYEIFPDFTHFISEFLFFNCWSILIASPPQSKFFGSKQLRQVFWNSLKCRALNWSWSWWTSPSHFPICTHKQAQSCRSLWAGIKTLFVAGVHL